MGFASACEFLVQSPHFIAWLPFAGVSAFFQEMTSGEGVAREEIAQPSRSCCRGDGRRSENNAFFVLVVVPYVLCVCVSQILSAPKCVVFSSLSASGKFRLFLCMLQLDMIFLRVASSQKWV